ncbi:hypothetical protein UVI_02014150 [Ustilaginoidea virens]|nr:hypothetical protein UVI_02014150 [Ustilaginoidea virens]
MRKKSMRKKSMRKKSARKKSMRKKSSGESRGGKPRPAPNQAKPFLNPGHAGVACRAASYSPEAAAAGSCKLGSCKRLATPVAVPGTMFACAASSLHLSPSAKPSWPLHGGKLSPGLTDDSDLTTTHALGLERSDPMALRRGYLRVPMLGALDGRVFAVTGRQPWPTDGFKERATQGRDSDRRSLLLLLPCLASGLDGPLCVCRPALMASGAGQGDARKSLCSTFLHHALLRTCLDFCAFGSFSSGPAGVILFM